MTPIPASYDRLLCSGVVPIMSENAAPQHQGAGEHSPASICADGPRRRAKLLTTELAVECAYKMFTQLTGGPHATKADPLAVYPTIEEIIIAQAGVLDAIGEKGSEKRTHANSLCADGLIDLEQALGYVLCDRFAGTMPSPIEARSVGKRAADKPPGKKEKDRWKERAKAARQAARKAGAGDEAALAAGLAARAKMEAAFVEMEVAISGLERPADAREPPAAVLEPEPSPAAMQVDVPAMPAPKPSPRASGQVRRLLGSKEAADVIYTCRELEYQQYELRAALQRLSNSPTYYAAADVELYRGNISQLETEYREELSAVAAAFPRMVCCAAFGTGGCSHGKPCECGWTQAPWPWIVHRDADDPANVCRFCDCHMEARLAWMKPAGVRYWHYLTPAARGGAGKP